MATAAVSVPRNEHPAAPSVEPRRRRRAGHEDDLQVRYFLAKEGSSPEKPELGAEAANEGEALIKAFQTKSGCSTPSWSTKRRRRSRAALRHW